MTTEFNLSNKIFSVRDDSDLGDGSLSVIITANIKEAIKELINWRNEQTGYREDSTLDKIKEIFGKELTE